MRAVGRKGFSPRGFGVIARLPPVGPSFSLRSEPAAGRFKAAGAPRRGRCSLPRKTGSRPSQGFTPACPQTRFALPAVPDL